MERDGGPDLGAGSGEETVIQGPDDPSLLREPGCVTFDESLLFPEPPCPPLLGGVNSGLLRRMSDPGAGAASAQHPSLL